MLCEKMTFLTQSARQYSVSEADESMIAEIRLRVIDHSEQQPFLSATNNPARPPGSWILTPGSSPRTPPSYSASEDVLSPFTSLQRTKAQIPRFDVLTKSQNGWISGLHFSSAALATASEVFSPS